MSGQPQAVRQPFSPTLYAISRNRGMGKVFARIPCGGSTSGRRAGCRGQDAAPAWEEMPVVVVVAPDDPAQAFKRGQPAQIVSGVAFAKSEN